MHAFAPFSGTHATVIALCSGATIALAMTGRTLLPEVEWRFRVGLASFAIALWLIYLIHWNWRGIDLERGLPLQFCDLTGLIAPLALMTQSPWLRAMLYFWGFALGVIAFIQPTVRDGPAHPKFWLFWFAHFIVVGFAVYDVAVLGFRPTWTDLLRASIASLAYLSVIAPINWMLDANYGYVGRPRADRTAPPLLTHLGPWPARIVVMAILTATTFLLILLPWQLAAKF